MWKQNAISYVAIRISTPPINATSICLYTSPHMKVIAMGSGPTQKALKAMQRTNLKCDKGTESGREVRVWKTHMPSALSGSHSGKDFIFVYSLVLDFKGNSMRN